jgi:serine/threonine-protein kinase RsbW
MSRSEVLVLTTRAGPRALEEIEGVLRQAWSENVHVPDGVRIQFGIAVGEIAANIIKHAAGGRQVQIRMELRVFPSEVWVEFIDDGEAMRADLSAAGMPDDMAESGRGLALAQTALGRLSYRRNSVNHWTLVSKLFS